MKIIPALMILAGLVLILVSRIWTASGTSIPGERVSTMSPEPDYPSDCGPVSLFMICKLAGHETSLEELRELTKTGVTGTSMSDLNRAATSIGFRVTACRCSFPYLCRHLSQANHYAILHSSRFHFAAAMISPDLNKARMLDLVTGVVDLTQSDLQTSFEWDGTALLISPG